MSNLILVGAVGILGALIVIAFIVSRIIYICPPNEVLIFSGGHRRIEVDGDERIVDPLRGRARPRTSRDPG